MATSCRIDETSGSDRFRWYAFDGLGSVLGELAEPVYDEELGRDTVHLVATNGKYDVYGAVRPESETSLNAGVKIPKNAERNSPDISSAGHLCL